MALICDTGGIYALYDAGDAEHAAVRAVVEQEPAPLCLPSVLLAELDYLLTTHLGVDAELDFLQGLADGSFELIHPTTEDLTRCQELIHQYRDLPLGLADASVVATAERLGIPRLLTLDQRHFRVVQPRRLSHFILLPADV